MAGNDIMLERLRQGTAAGEGCSDIFVRSLKSDLVRILRSYCELSGLELEVESGEQGVRILVEACASGLKDIGSGTAN